MPRLGITRSDDQLNGLRRKAAEKGVELISLPLTKSVSIPFSIPDELPLDSVDWILFTSKNGVESFFSQLDQKLSDSTKIAVIGTKTEEAVNKQNYSVAFRPDSSIGKDFFAQFTDQIDLHKKNILYFRAEQVLTQPESFFIKIDCTFHQVICYKTVECNLSADIINKLTSEDYLFFTAPSTVESYRKQFGKPDAKIIAIGKTTEDAIKNIKWEISKTLDKPEIDSVLEYM